MTIESSGARGPKYRVNPDNPCQVDVQYKPRQRWALYDVCATEQQARDKVWQLERANTCGAPS